MNRKTQTHWRRISIFHRSGLGIGIGQIRIDPWHLGSLNRGIAGLSLFSLSQSIRFMLFEFEIWMNRLSCIILGTEAPCDNWNRKKEAGDRDECRAMFWIKFIVLTSCTQNAALIRHWTAAERFGCTKNCAHTMDIWLNIQCSTNIHHKEVVQIQAHDRRYFQ